MLETSQQSHEQRQGHSKEKPRKLHSISNTADILDCSMDTVRRYIQEGKLDSVLLSPRCRRVTDESLQELIDGGAAPKKKPKALAQPAAT